MSLDQLLFAEPHPAFFPLVLHFPAQSMISQLTIYNTAHPPPTLSADPGGVGGGWACGASSSHVGDWTVCHRPPSNTCIC